MNVSVATIERRLNRLIPHTPCPEVHPPPRRVPNPTSPPATAITHQGPSMRWGKSCGHPRKSPTPVSINPARNAQRHRPACPGAPTTCSKIPLMPAICPLSTNIAPDARPIITPPTLARTITSVVNIVLNLRVVSKTKDFP